MCAIVSTWSLSLQDLIEDLKGELSGDYKELVMAMFVSPAEYDAWCVKEAIYVSVLLAHTPSETFM